QVFETTIPGKDGKPAKLFASNIAMLVKPFRKKTEGHATIRQNDIAQFIAYHGNNSKAVLALTILMYTGVRVSDLSFIGPQHRRGDTFVIRAFKNRNRNPVTLSFPVHPILDAVLKMHTHQQLTYVVTDHGRPFSIKGLSQRISEWFTQAGLPHLTAHSVRKGLATNMAENEATDSMLEGMFGWRDGKTSKIYTQSAERSRLARHAISKIDWGDIGNFLPHPNGDPEKHGVLPTVKSNKIN
ncbi:site-specific integrase, partial [Paraburkholderia aspalathi]|nr:site-specific integrase [Paraburkholderia aspalathi]